MVRQVCNHPASPGTFPTTCYRQIPNNHKNKSEKPPQFSVSAIHDGNTASKGAADNINTENLHNSTSHPLTKHRPAAISLVGFPKSEIKKPKKKGFGAKATCLGGGGSLSRSEIYLLQRGLFGKRQHPAFPSTDIVDH